MPIVPPDRFPFCGPSYLAASPVIDAQRSINLYPEPGYKSSKTAMALIGRPGLASFSTPAGATAGRSLWAGSGRLFACGGSHVYEINNAGGVITDYGSALANSQAPAPMVSNNQQLLICDPTQAAIYYINPVGPALTTVFHGVALEYLDGFHVAIAAGASLSGGNPNQINVSNFLDAGTPGSWNSLNFVLRTGSADLITQLATLNNLLWIFGQKTIEVWYNAGNQGFPFARVNGGTINLGCLAPWSVVKFYNSIVWLGADDRGYAQVYMAQGMNPVRVSNPAIEYLIYQYGTSSTLSAATAFGYQEAGHTFYVLNLCNINYQPQVTIVYDLATGLWHERVYSPTGPYPTTFASTPNFSINSNGPNFVADSFSGKIYYQNINLPNDGDPVAAKITYTRTAPHISETNKWIKYPRFELDGDFGTATPTLDYSDDGGRNFGGRTRALQQAVDQGRGTVSPTFRRFFATQLGRSRDRVFKVSITDGSNLIRIANAYVTAAEGTEQ